MRGSAGLWGTRWRGPQRCERGTCCSTPDGGGPHLISSAGSAIDACLSVRVRSSAGPPGQVPALGARARLGTAAASAASANAIVTGAGAVTHGARCEQDGRQLPRANLVRARRCQGAGPRAGSLCEPCAIASRGCRGCRIRGAPWRTCLPPSSLRPAVAGWERRPRRQLIIMLCTTATLHHVGGIPAEAPLGTAFFFRRVLGTQLGSSRHPQVRH